MSPLNEKPKSPKDNNLQSHQPQMDRKTDSKNINQAENQAQNLTDELAEITAVWPELPEHIKAAVKALVQTHITEIK